MTKTISPPFRRGEEYGGSRAGRSPQEADPFPASLRGGAGDLTLPRGRLAWATSSPAPRPGPSPASSLGLSSASSPGPRPALPPGPSPAPRLPPISLAHARPARDFEPGAVIRIEDRETPCRIEFRKTGVRLEAAADGSRPGPGFTVVMDGRGRFYTTGVAGWRSVISVWDSEGKYLRSFGGEGGGPGKFRAIDALFVDGEDNLHVLDFAGWSVFSPNHKLLRRTLVKPPFSLRREFGAVLDDGTILSSDRFAGPGGEAYFRVGDPDGTPRRAWAPASGGPDLGMGYRPISYVGGETFWAGPAADDPKAWEYVLEEWGTDGELKRAVHREAAWFQWRGGGGAFPGGEPAARA